MAVEIGNAATSLMSTVDSIQEKLHTHESEIESISEEVTTNMQNIREEMQSNMEVVRNRLEDINRLIEVNDDRRERRHALEMKYLRSERRAAMKMYKRARIMNTILGVIIIALLIILTTNINKYSTVIERYDEVVNSYTELLEKYNMLEENIDNLQNETIPEVSVPSLDATTHTNITVIETTDPAVPTIVVNLTDITEPSNLTAAQLDAIIDARLADINKPDARISGIGEALFKMEQEYGVNALFCLSVGSFESGHGTSAAATSRNNLFGLIGSDGIMQFDSIDECISYWGRLIRNYYIDQGLTTISAIQKKYCPGSSTWTGNIEYFMDTYAEHVKSYFV